MSHSWLTISVGDKIPEDAVCVDDGGAVFVGRARADGHTCDWEYFDYQIAEISVETETNTVQKILTGLREPDRDVGEVLVSQIVEWKPAKRGDQIPQEAIQFMNNGSDGPCVVARCIGDGALKPCKLNTSDSNVESAAWNFRYITGECTTAVQEGDILVEAVVTVLIMCEHTTGKDGHGYIRCTKLNGDVIGMFEVPEGKDLYGPWLQEAVSVARKGQEGCARLVKRSGDMI